MPFASTGVGGHSQTSPCKNVRCFAEELKCDGSCQRTACYSLFFWCFLIFRHVLFSALNLYISYVFLVNTSGMLTACHIFLFVTALHAFSMCSKLCSKWRGVQMGKVTVSGPSATRNCSCDSESPTSCLRGRSLHHCAFDCGCGNGARRTLAWFPMLCKLVGACWRCILTHLYPLVLMGKPLWVIQYDQYVIYLWCPYPVFRQFRIALDKQMPGLVLLGFIWSCPLEPQNHQGVKYHGRNINAVVLGICLESLGIPDRPVHYHYYHYYYYYLNEQAWTSAALVQACS